MSLSFNFDVGQVTTITNPEDFPIKLLNQLNLVLSPAMAELTDNVAEQPTISYEQVEALEADVVLLAHVSDEVRKGLEALPVFANLPAVSEDRYVFVDLFRCRRCARPCCGLGHALDELVPALERALGAS